MRNKNILFYDSDKNIKNILTNEDSLPPENYSNRLPSHTDIIPTKIKIMKKKKKYTNTKKKKYTNTKKKKYTNTKKRRKFKK